MEQKIKEKILEFLKSETNQDIINSDEFYFQKAKETLDKFLSLEVSEESKRFLIENKKEYDELKQLFKDSEELAEFGKTLLTLISYCDSNAYGKNELNQYDDKRVLALAFVRMNNWVEQLITYKFTGQLTEGSIKNAVEYLLEPENNFTMLSENHRHQICDNLFNKPFNKNTFKDVCLGFFSEFSITVKNPENYTHLLTRLSYDIAPDWKESIIGLLCPDTTGWQINAVKDTENGNHIALWNHKKPNGKDGTLKLLRQCIAENGFFRIFYTSKYQVKYIAEIVDFVINQQKLDESDWENKYGHIEWYNDNFNKYVDGDKSASWVYLARKIYKVNSNEYLDYKYYKSYGYPSVGCQAPLVSYKNNLELEKQKQMSDYINLLNYKKQIILQGPPGTGKTREAELIAKDMLGLSDIKDLENNEQYKLVQFHPSYTYEDFVRGIVAKPTEDGNGILYEAENKTLGEFAKNALDNFLASKGLFQDENFETRLQVLIDEVNNEVVNGKVYSFGDKSTAEVFAVGNDYFYYSFPTRKEIRYKLLFSDLKKIFKNRSEIKIPINLRDAEKDLQLAMKGKYPYYFMLLRKLESYKIDSKSKDKEKLKEFVLVIDEINRANLSSVLGELIYALEYREKGVESMYEVGGSKKLILPPNLYIIGTMNTADRSVGHIDYAIRRRFAFVEILPEALSDNVDIYFNLEGFNAVSALFNSENVSNEFEIKDVQIGHSYFIAKKSEAKNETERDDIFKMKMKYEVVPILEEYVKDGVLVKDFGGQSIKKHISTLKP